MMSTWPATNALAVLRTLGFAGCVVLSGCASLEDDAVSAPEIEISVTGIDPVTNMATVSVTNHSRSRALVLTNALVWQAEAEPKWVDRPNHRLDDDMIFMTHDARLEPGDSWEYMEVRLQSMDRPRFPAVYACWDNRSWTCSRYWLIPATQSWEALVAKAQHDDERAVPRLEEKL